MAPIAGVAFRQIDFLDPNAPAVLHEMLGGGADVVLSDMAANATGHKKTDQLKIMALVEAGVEFAREVLHPGGAFLTKVLQGGTEPKLLAGLKRDYATVRNAKRKASAVITPVPLICTVISTASAPTATPAAIDSCWATLTSGVARLMRRASISA